MQQGEDWHVVGRELLHKHLSRFSSGSDARPVRSWTVRLQSPNASDRITAIKKGRLAATL